MVEIHSLCLYSEAAFLIWTDPRGVIPSLDPSMIYRPVCFLGRPMTGVFSNFSQDTCLFSVFHGLIFLCLFSLKTTRTSKFNKLVGAETKNVSGKGIAFIWVLAEGQKEFTGRVYTEV